MNQKSLPLDLILIIIRHYADQSTLYQLGLTCRSISPHAFLQLWHMPYITTAKSLDQLSTTLSLPSSHFPYKDWMTGLALHMIEQEDEYTYQSITPDIFDSLCNLKLEILSLLRLHIPIKDLSFQQFLKAQLDQGLSELHLYQCTPITLATVSTKIQQHSLVHLRTLCIHNCYLTDTQVEHMVRFCPNLQVLRLEECGCLSDTSMLTIAQNCLQLNTLVVTLPRNIAQSNMITVRTIEALQTHCLFLKKFICGGQIRISEYINNSNNSTNFSIIISDPPSWD
ncbi:hypothetical protein INT48_000345 [Thamnidium elegans]|uniref:F-box domain-containing protein n=1 Tax=Thamnidium elegans TaxID=101142 RepID=A0A8H7SV22_9FUNG|nr:hypothetical protein INT48_000345 [Thamnidium elegans]